MPLHLAPEIETAVRQHAAREGVSIDTLLSRAFPTLSRPEPPSADDPASRIANLLQQWQHDYGLPPRPDGKQHTPVEELFAQWEREDAELSPEEASAEQHLWEATQREHSEISL